MKRPLVLHGPILPVPRYNYSHIVISKSLLRNLCCAYIDFSFGRHHGLEDVVHLKFFQHGAEAMKTSI